MVMVSEALMTLNMSGRTVFRTMGLANGDGDGDGLLNCPPFCGVGTLARGFLPANGVAEAEIRWCAGR